MLILLQLLFFPSLFSCSPNCAYGCVMKFFFLEEKTRVKTTTKKNNPNKKGNNIAKGCYAPHFHHEQFHFLFYAVHSSINKRFTMIFSYSLSLCFVVVVSFWLIKTMQLPCCLPVGRRNVLAKRFCCSAGLRHPFVLFSHYAKKNSSPFLPSHIVLNKFSKII